MRSISQEMWEKRKKLLFFSSFTRLPCNEWNSWAAGPVHRVRLRCIRFQHKLPPFCAIWNLNELKNFRKFFQIDWSFRKVKMDVAVQVKRQLQLRVTRRRPFLLLSRDSSDVTRFVGFFGELFSTGLNWSLIAQSEQVINIHRSRMNYNFVASNEWNVHVCKWSDKTLKIQKVNLKKVETNSWGGFIFYLFLEQRIWPVVKRHRVAGPSVTPANTRDRRLPTPTSGGSSPSTDRRFYLEKKNKSTTKKNENKIPKIPAYF